MPNLVKGLRWLGWVFLAIGITVVVGGVVALWQKGGFAFVLAALNPANTSLWFSILITFVPAAVSLFGSFLLARGNEDET